MKKEMIYVFLAVPIIFGQAAAACTDFQIKTKDGAVVVGRSLEWGENMKSQLRTHPRQERYQSKAPENNSGLCWQSKYGYVGADCYGLNICIDGINEKGFSVGGLWFPGAEYQNNLSRQEYKQALNVIDVGGWMLGNFASVEEAKEAILKICVWGKAMPQIGDAIPTMHFAIHDAQGHSAVIEFIKGSMKVYDNPNGVLTNAPAFDWHITNLCNYLTVNPVNPRPLIIEGTVLAPPGQGSGFLGIPGDWTPPSRFVRTTAMLHYAKQATNAKDGVNLAEHILNSVDIPLGGVRPAGGDINKSDYTQWVIIKDLTNRILYFRSYENLNLRSIDLNKLDIGPGAIVKPVSIAE